MRKEILFFETSFLIILLKSSYGLFAEAATAGTETMYNLLMMPSIDLCRSGSFGN